MTLVGGFDLETTGLDVEKARIIEVAFVLMELETGVERLRFERRCNPGIPIEPKAIEIHGINDADVMGALPFSAFAAGFVKLFGAADLIVGHNIDRFDMPLLGHELVRAGVSLPTIPPTFDTMLAGRGCTDDGKVPTLGELCYALDTPYDPTLAHGATYDVAVNLQAFRRGWQLGVFRLPEIKSALQEAA